MSIEHDEKEKIVAISKEALMGLIAHDEDDGGEGVFDPGDDTTSLTK